MSRRSLVLAPVVCLVTACVLVVAAPAIAAIRTPERTGFALLNGSRVRRDLHELRLSARLSRHAESQSRRMARRRALSHSALHIDGYAALGECVGVGSSVRGVHHAFMRSSVHRTIILGRWRFVGVGVVRARGLVYVTEIFAR